jgi:PAS domain S-box-containing protein
MGVKLEEPPQAGEILRHLPALAYFLFAVLLAASAGWYFTAMKIWRLEMESNETHLVDLVAKGITAELQPVISDLLILVESSVYMDYLAHPTEAERDQVDDILLRWSTRKTNYFEMRYLDSTGEEISRVQRDGGEPQIVPRSKLRNSGQRIYFKRAMTLASGEVLASAFDLLMDGDKIRQPPHPTLRLCIPVFDKKGARRGVFIINFEGERILEKFRTEASNSAGQIQLINQEGFWLKGPSRDDEWAFMYPEKKDRTFGQKYPQAWLAVSTAEVGKLYTPRGFFAFQTVSPLDVGDEVPANSTSPAKRKTYGPQSYDWKIVSVVANTVLDSKSANMRMRLMVIDALGLIIALWTSWNVGRSRVSRERAARAMERQAELLDLAQDAIVVQNLKHTILYWNAGAERLYGWSRDEVMGLNYGTVLRPATDTPWSSVYESLLTKGQWSGEATTVHRDGTQIVSLNRLTLQRDPRGNPAAVMSIATDIRERKRAEAELHAAKEAAEAASRAKSEFLAVMSHEIRTPMNGVIGMAGLLLDTQLSLEQREYAETVRQSADALLTIINDILDFSKIEAGKLVIEPIPCDLRLAVEEIAELMASKAHEKGIDMILRYSPDAPRRVVCDPGRIRQILINLVGNAIKFTAKGHVYVSVVCEEKTAGQARLFFSVEDTGIGIPADKLGQIFERFAQADTSTTRQFGGTGLGLAISKQLAELMGGTMSVESRAGEGSQFWMTLPLSLDVPPEEAEPPHADLSGARVLGVDDNPTNLFVLREQLNSWGLRNDMCSCAEDALRILRAAASAGDPYHIAVLDQQMPGMDGETLGGLIKAAPELQSTLLVMLTSLGLRGDAARMKALGFAAYLTKPTRQSQLLDALATVWSARSKVKPAQLVTRHTLAEARAASPAAPPPQPEAQRNAAAVRGRILVVEDNVVNQRVASRLLEKMGFRVDLAANGGEAVEMIELLPYDAVFMDCQMPEMDGYQATREIRNREGNGKHRVIIAMTANAMQGDREKCLAAGMDDYISKPIRAPDLAGVLTRHLPQFAASEKRADSEKISG